ncbi:uncharacterized protein LOC106112129 [Falco peregrinus]|uniref:uncharacterized protein LOC106112129 n=1 Tax=Falco peregrinus TaxID=8954 RepID=UPI00247867F4|nr:uncharacterized protein LOC106112129 [Falco peregrinus]
MKVGTAALARACAVAPPPRHCWPLVPASRSRAGLRGGAAAPAAASGKEPPLPSPEHAASARSAREYRTAAPLQPWDKRSLRVLAAATAPPLARSPTTWRPRGCGAAAPLYGFNSLSLGNDTVLPLQASKLHASALGRFCACGARAPYAKASGQFCACAALRLPVTLLRIRHEGSNSGPAERASGVTVGQKMDMSQQPVLVGQKADHILGCIQRKHDQHVKGKTANIGGKVNGKLSSLLFYLWTTSRSPEKTIVCLCSMLCWTKKVEGWNRESLKMETSLGKDAT